MAKVTDINRKKKQTRKKQRDYQHKFGIAFNQSTNRIMLTIPDIVRFPATRAWVWLRDPSTVMVSPDQPRHSLGAVHVGMSRQKSLPGCRVLTFEIGPNQGVGEHFRMTDTQYKLEDGRFAVKIPDPDDRRPPKANRYAAMQAKPEPKVEASPPAAVPGYHLVLIERGTEELTFRVPDQDLKVTIGDWLFKGYLEKDNG